MLPPSANMVGWAILQPATGYLWGSCHVVHLNRFSSGSSDPEVQEQIGDIWFHSRAERTFTQIRPLLSPPAWPPSRPQTKAPPRSKPRSDPRPPPLLGLCCVVVVRRHTDTDVITLQTHWSPLRLVPLYVPLCLLSFLPQIPQQRSRMWRRLIVNVRTWLCSSLVNPFKLILIN